MSRRNEIESGIGWFLVGCVLGLWILPAGRIHNLLFGLWLLSASAMAWAHFSRAEEEDFVSDRGMVAMLIIAVLAGVGAIREGLPVLYVVFPVLFMAGALLLSITNRRGR